MSLLRTENWAKQLSSRVDCQRRVRCSRAASKECLISSAIVLVARSLISHITHYRDPLSEGWVPSNVVLDEWHRVVTKATRWRYQKGGFSRVLSERKWSSQFVSELSSSSWSAVVIPQCPSTSSGGRRKKSLRGDRGKATWWGLLEQGLVFGLQRWWNFPPFNCYHSFDKGPLFTWFGQQK